MSHRFRSAVVLTLVACAGVPAAAQAKAKTKAKPDVTVMSRNLYLGADIITLASAPDVPTEMQNAQTLHATVDATNFPLRAKAIAKEIKANNPDVVGLQEVAHFQRGADGVHDSTKNATTNLYDYLALLKSAIKADGLSYKVASKEDWLDVEVPSGDGYDMRLTMSNVVLVKSGKKATVKVTKDVHGVFPTQLTVPLPDQTVKQSRGYAGIDGTVAGKHFRYLDPHAEAYSGDIAATQFKELLAGAAKSKKVTTIIAGDFNSDPANKAAAGGYNAAIAAGYVDTAKRESTCCQDEKLDNQTSKLDQWIDHIVARPKVKVLRTAIVGNKLSDRTGGLWPSDHAGIVTKLRILK